MEPGNNSQIILIVDDNPTNLEVLSEALMITGLQVAVALDGESAIEQVQYHPPDLILLDVMMPGIDGFETCRRLKANPLTQEIPIIFMTALSETESKVKGLSVGAVDYITKPFQQEEVLARVKVHLQLHHLNQRLEIQNGLLQQFNETLEQRVQERTADLQQAQVQLIQQEKLSALGQLVAGIAHEINNPVNFIYGNFPPAKHYIQDLFDLISLYQARYAEPSKEISDKIEEIDLDFLRLDLPKLLDSMQVGSERIREIVLSLRNFSRLDEADFKQVDLHDGIENTLLILGHRLNAKSEKYRIQIAKNYGDIPPVACFPGQLNQVIMNLLVNAIDALEHSIKERSEPVSPSIHICTHRIENNWIQVQIKDNGSGMPEAIRQKIFDPFFTTKPVGKGTGLGLAISHQIIVEKHGGKIECHSILGQGTEFTLQIPIDQLEPEHERSLSFEYQTTEKMH
ncbi:response regulator [Myxacorys almedinensis A]|uniref:histidine kinase n=2 Tax=Myxacorys TaxID=2056239 RepID=A0A8J7Z7P4_9CYAN|nr:response regulator [Myxacorys almedinensis]NDJ19436.1 response regulator [Myxacorys almedinensis A]